MELSNAKTKRVYKVVLTGGKKISALHLARVRRVCAVTQIFEIVVDA